MLEAGTRRHIRNVMEYPSGLIVCLDQNLKRMDEYYGPKEKVLPLLRHADLSQARIKRKVRKGGTPHFKWEFISPGKFFTGCR